MYQCNIKLVMGKRVLTKKQSAPVAQVDELYNLENYEDAELYEILGLSSDFTGDDQTLSNAILKQIQKFSEKRKFKFKRK